MAVLDGEAAEGVGIRLGITLETVRTHIRNAYVKLGVGSREQMFRLLIPFFDGASGASPGS
jgi:DNA-binding CsgD family transcriptional regulator